ncbi:MAG TPA: hypothetical protein DIV86_00020 [Alphaproteobacteria bacterium]|nr:hypothetical protein [Alphaproteobacteria bacterium]
MPRLIVELTSNQHYEIKNRAVLEGKSIKNYVIEILFKQQKVKIPEKLLKDSKFFEGLKEAFNGKKNVSEQDLFSFFEQSANVKKIANGSKTGKSSALKPTEKPKPRNGRNKASSGKLTKGKHIAKKVKKS